MKKNIRKFLAAVSAAVLCAVPMMNGINASANEYVLKNGGFVDADINHDHKIDITDYNYFLQYLNGNDATKASLEKKFPSITVKDYNGNGITDKDDAELIKFAYTHYPNYDDSCKFINCYGKIKINGKEYPAYVYGDANGDLKFNAQDIVAISNYLKNPNYYPTAKILYNRSHMSTNRSGKLNMADYKHFLDRLIDNRFGDANGNGRVDMSDGVAIDQYLKNPSKYPAALNNLQYSDINGDGKLTKEDMKAFEQIIQKNLGYVVNYNFLTEYKVHVKLSLLTYLDLYRNNNLIKQIEDELPQNK